MRARFGLGGLSARGVLLTLCLWLGLTACAVAGVMNRSELAQRFPAPYIIGDRDSVMPIWPIFAPNFQQKESANELVGYVFESIDLAPVPGFSGVPVNLLIAMDQQGNFLDVSVLSQHEPVFVAGLGEGPMHAFVSQYKGLSLKQNVKILIGPHGARSITAQVAELDGVTRATASLHIINQSILSAALKVARKKLGFAEGRDPDLIARIKPDVMESHSVKELIESGLIKHRWLSNAEVEKKFSNTSAAGLDAEALAHPQDAFIDLYAALVSVPSVGRNLLSQATWERLQSRLDPGDHAVLVMSKGRYTVTGESFLRGSAPDRIVLKQDQLPIEMRDLNLDITFKDDPGLDLDRETYSIFRIIGRSGLDPSRPLDFVLPVTRLKGIIFPEKLIQDFDLRLELPERLYTMPEGDNKSWIGSWRDRKIEVVILLVGLGVLSVALVMQRSLVARQRRFTLFRNLYLLFTLLFIGWHAQGQLSIVNLTSVWQAALAGRSLSFYLYDPMTVTLTLFTLLSLVFWGRGSFCGWLCPFGALQELAAKLGQRFKIRQVKLKPAIDARLKWLKYLALAGILVSASFSSSITDLAVEVEPFKTVITLNFVRSWPFVVYALGLLVANLFVYKLFCRFLCPFGAGLALLGRVRLLNWIPRRRDCGSPCQTCRHQCEYQAITPSGRVQYDECFQCMECVVIYASDERCAPLMLEKKRAKVIPIQSNQPNQ